ncbi:TPA: hypothetical protein ACKONR_002627 [Clostridioides difficile]|uniref:hypothetical protein n=1 Tax=Clostridioides difficile TaxID=1496 RepID=UPI00038D6C63|nr:hypothetical protein [Clostridioides difficile]EQE83182.1 hypothetical protein QCW_3479 [Clostridioides difficile CD69]MCG7701469.1 hypothetical protein [Clostridioides difficile]MCP8412489.1 hypothetical protein [Clostridioides difficile]MDC9391582.1 hypothetical protein [Clostridioides difficile]MDK1636804.1 hypothetical protein [Clostridioides difficile]
MLEISHKVKEIYPNIKFGVMVINITHSKPNKENFLILKNPTIKNIIEQHPKYNRKKKLKQSLFQVI